MKLGPSLSHYIKKRGWTLSRLAKETGIPPSTLHGWTTGRKAANFDDLKKVATSLQVSIHELIYGTSDPFAQPGNEILKEIFKGDIRVTLHKIERNK